MDKSVLKTTALGKTILFQVRERGDAENLVSDLLLFQLKLRPIVYTVSTFWHQSVNRPHHEIKQKSHSFL